MLSDAKSAYAKGDYHSTVYITQEFLLKNSGRRGAKEAYIMLGNAYKAMGQYDKAMLKYTEAIEFYPKDEDLTLALADIYYFYTWIGCIIPFQDILEKKEALCLSCC